jgi:hypothetical protein
MRALLIPAAAIIIILSNGACKSSSSPKTFCDTACLQDTLRFFGNHQLMPYIFITAKDCKPESIIRGYKGMGTNLTTAFSFGDVQVNKDFIRCLFNDTAYAYILFNDCLTGRGYQMKLPFSTTGNMSKRSSGINNLDPKFAVADDMIAYTDRGNIYVEQISSGKEAMMTFGKALEIDYDAIHEYIDSVHVTPERIWVKVKVEDKWKELEKKIVLE